MRILQLCNKMPYPPRDGYAIAAYNLAQAFYTQGHKVAVLAMNTTRHPVDEKKIPAFVKKELNLHTVKVDNRLSAAGAFVKLLQNKSYNVSRFVSSAFEKKLEELLPEHKPEIVQLEGLYLTPYIKAIRKHSKALIVLRAHNAEHLVWYRNSEQEKNFAKKVYLKVLAKQLRKYETEVFSQCDALVPVSDTDAQVFRQMGNSKPTHVCPVSYNEELHKHTGKEPIPGSVFFIGTLDWMPNLEGLKWFLEHVWDHIRQKFPQSTFYLAGRNIPSSIKTDKKRSIVVEGEVANGPAFMSDKQIMVVPLFAGSGMRVKIIEGMALGRTIISTTIGAEGIACRHNEQVMIADTKEEFIKALHTCLSDAAHARKLGVQAAGFAKRNYSAAATASGLLSFYKSLLR